MDVREHFSDHGVRFITHDGELDRRSAGIKAVLFDWDGVFNDGFKDAEGGSPFSEVDSMGVNLLRFALWLRNSRQLPTAAIITGQQNPQAERFAERERLHAAYMGFTNKPDAFSAFLGAFGLRPAEVAFFFDDVLDLPVAEQCGLRIMIGHRATHYLQHTAAVRGSADVIVPLGGGHHGLRQACELLIAHWGQWDRVLDERIQYTAIYQEYLSARNAVRTAIHVHKR